MAGLCGWHLCAAAPFGPQFDVGLRLFIVNTRQLLKDKFICTHAYDAGLGLSLDLGLGLGSTLGSHRELCLMREGLLCAALCSSATWTSVKHNADTLCSSRRMRDGVWLRRLARVREGALIEVRPRRLIGVKCR